MEFFDDVGGLFRLAESHKGYLSRFSLGVLEDLAISNLHPWWYIVNYLATMMLSVLVHEKFF